MILRDFLLYSSTSFRFNFTLTFKHFTSETKMMDVYVFFSIKIGKCRN